MRPDFLAYRKCEHVLVEGVTFDDSPMWNVHFVYTDRAINMRTEAMILHEQI